MSKLSFKSFEYKTISENIVKIIEDSTYDSELADTLLNLFDYMIEKNLIGGCHALSAVLYIALNEMGYSPILCIGECQKNGRRPFDHSWIEIDNKTIDLSIYMPMQNKRGSFGGPVILNIDSYSFAPNNLDYGINTGLPFSSDTTFAINTGLTEYMDKFPFDEDGLWTVLEKIYVYEGELDIASLKNKYKDVKRKLIR